MNILFHGLGRIIFLQATKREKLSLIRSDLSKKQQDLIRTLTSTAVRSSIFLFHAFSDEFQIVKW